MAPSKKVKRPSVQKNQTKKKVISKLQSTKMTVEKKTSGKKLRKTNVTKATKQNRGVVYFSHLPHGFYEKELRMYCDQFGKVTGVHAPMSVNGNSKGYAFVEFLHPEVAQVVADTMNNYLMFNKLIKTRLVPTEEQKPWIFSNGIDPVKLSQKRRVDALATRERTLTPQEEEAYKKRTESRIRRLQNKLKKNGINYDFTVAS